MADPHVKDVSASSVLHHPPDSTVGMAKQSKKEKEPEIIEVGGQHGVPGGGRGSSHPHGDRDVGASDAVDEIGLSVADGKTSASGKDEQIGLPGAIGGTGNRGGGEVAPDPAPVPQPPPRSRAPNPGPNRTKLQLVEGGSADPWFEAIEKKDCRRLMEILRVTPYESRAPLCHRTGKEGRTALHVAAMQGCFRLAKQVIDYKVNETSETVADLERALMQRIDISKSAEDFIDAKDGRSGLIAYEMAKDIIGNRSITQYIKYVKKKDYEIMFEAHPGTEWHTALAEGRSHMLKLLLQFNTQYLLETCDGFTVLDVAILKDDWYLVQLLEKAFGLNKKISWGASYFPDELSWDQMMGPRHLPQIRCPELKDTFVGKITGKQVGFFNSVGSALELAKKLKRKVSTHVLAREVDTNSNLFESEVQEHIDFSNREFWKPEWDQGFLGDVDYNFEDEDSLRKSILRFHYACKDLEKFKEYILAITEIGFIRDSPNIFVYCCVMHDGQGRTPFHTMVEYYNYENHSNLTFENLILLSNEFKQGSDPSGWNFVMELLSYSHDSNGRSPLMRAITRQYVENKTMVSTHLIRFYEILKINIGFRKKHYNAIMGELNVQKPAITS